MKETNAIENSEDSRLEESLEDLRLECERVIKQTRQDPRLGHEGRHGQKRRKIN